MKLDNEPRLRGPVDGSNVGHEPGVLLSALLEWDVGVQPFQPGRRLLMP